MGHQGDLKRAYRDLIERLAAGPVAMPEPEDARARAGWREILEIVYTPEDAALAARLPVLPTDLTTIAARVGIPEKELGPRLDAMADKGLVLDLRSPRRNETHYLLAPPVVGFFEFSLMRAQDTVPKKRIAEALEAYTHGDATFASEVFGQETVIGRALVHETALGDGPLPEVLTWERATAIIDEARSAAVSLCYCRHKAEHLGKRCDAPVENCLSFNGGADFVIRRGFGRAVDRKEATDILEAARAEGLAQIADNVRNDPAYICNCCGCCCGQLEAVNDYDLRAVNPSGFLATPDGEGCTGCSRCARACPVGAITMTPRRAEARRRNGLAPRVMVERCLGCGVCASTCRQGALRMARRAEPSRVPANAVERSVRMALERGRLAHLLFDRGAGLGSRFLNEALQVLCRLPVTGRILASEQLRSRFVRYALGEHEYE